MIRRSNLCQLVDLIGDLCHFPWNVLQITHLRVKANFKLRILFDRYLIANVHIFAIATEVSHIICYFAY